MARRRVEQVVKAKVELKEVGVAGLKVSSGLVREEYQPELKGKKAEKVYREMSYDPAIAPCLGTLKQLLKAVPVTVKDGGDKLVGEFVRECFADMSHSWADALAEILTVFNYGWSASEICYKYRKGENARPGLSSRFDDGKIGWRKLAPRAQDSRDAWEFDDEGGVQAMRQVTTMPSHRATIPIEKLLLFKLDSEKGSPEPAPLIRGAYTPWFFAKRLRVFEGIGIERGLGGIPKISAPANILSASATGTNAQLRDALLEIGKNLRDDEQAFVALPSDRFPDGSPMYDISLITTQAGRGVDIDKALARYHRDCALVLLCDFILLGHEKVGSFALADSKTSVTALAVRGWLTAILETFNRHAIPRLLRLNGFSVIDPPKLVAGDVETPDLAALGSYIATLSGAGMALFPNPELEDVLLRAASLPTATGQAEVGKRDFASLRALAAEAKMARDAFKIAHAHQ